MAIQKNQEESLYFPEVETFNPNIYRHPEKAVTAHKEYLAELNRTKGGVPDGEYTVGRPLGKKEDAFKYFPVPETYHQALPAYGGLTFEDCLEQMLQTQEDVTLCDLGFGAGLMLLELSDKQPFKSAIETGQLKIIAVGNPNFCKHQFSNPTKGGLSENPTFESLVAKGVQIEDRDILEVLWSMENNKVDMFVSAVTMNWINYPKWEIMEQINRILKENGMAFISNIEFNVSKKGASPWVVDWEANPNQLFSQAEIKATLGSRGLVLEKNYQMKNIISNGKYGDNLISLKDETN